MEAPVDCQGEERSRSALQKTKFVCKSICYAMKRSPFACLDGQTTSTLCGTHHEPCKEGPGEPCRIQKRPRDCNPGAGGGLPFTHMSAEYKGHGLPAQQKVCINAPFPPRGCRKRMIPFPPLHGREQGEGDDPVHRSRFTPHPDLLPSARGEGMKPDSLSPRRELRRLLMKLWGKGRGYDLSPKRGSGSPAAFMHDPDYREALLRSLRIRW